MSRGSAGSADSEAEAASGRLCFIDTAVPRDERELQGRSSVGEVERRAGAGPSLAAPSKAARLRHSLPRPRRALGPAARRTPTRTRSVANPVGEVAA